MSNDLMCGCTTYKKVAPFINRQGTLTGLCMILLLSEATYFFVCYSLFSVEPIRVNRINFNHIIKAII